MRLDAPHGQGEEAMDRTAPACVKAALASRHAMRFDQVVSQDPEVVSGALVFAGTRVPVQTLIDYLKTGETLDRFLDGFPTVRREQAEAYLELTLDEAQARV